MMVDTHRGHRRRRDFIAGDEKASTGANRAKLGHWLTVTGDDERLARRYRLDHLGVLIAQFALGDSAGHRSIVAESATAGYTLR